MGGGGGGRLFEAGRLLNFSAIRMGAYSRWALIRGSALIRINTVSFKGLSPIEFKKRTAKGGLMSEPRGVLLGILGGGVPPDSPNPDPISDQENMSSLFR